MNDSNTLRQSETAALTLLAGEAIRRQLTAKTGKSQTFFNVTHACKKPLFV
ncbi:MAG: hypothetical protein IJ154_02730 [Bacteroidales bacterium]|nr:hypothetical protein [Bacteroidales bacterium]